MGTARIEGVDYVRKSPGEAGWLRKAGGWTGSATGGNLTRGTRKPTDLELTQTWAALERTWAASVHAAGPKWLRSSWGEGMAFRVAQACHAEMERRGLFGDAPAATTRKAAKRKAKPARVRENAKRGAKASAERDLFRMYRADLEALGTADALAEIQRREIKRAGKRGRRKVAA